ncbi:hypothetical protein GGR56DRAFT_283641 [Xylariaceae sp. FL0804]|nr:hypothetical protein GGR56DRAFT_283641 [Xylariaceae sp. FL0804]
MLITMNLVADPINTANSVSLNQGRLSCGLPTCSIDEKSAGLPTPAANSASRPTDFQVPPAAYRSVFGGIWLCRCRQPRLFGSLLPCFPLLVLCPAVFRGQPVRYQQHLGPLLAKRFSDPPPSHSISMAISDHEPRASQDLALHTHMHTVFLGHGHSSWHLHITVGRGIGGERPGAWPDLFARSTAISQRRLSTTVIGGLCCDNMSL